MKKTPNFIYSTIFKKNSLEIREYLEMLGYENWNCISSDAGIATVMFNYITVSLSMPNESTPIYTGLEDFVDEEWLEDNRFINCHSNEDLFKAIVALRDDSDIYQWFTNEDCSKWSLSKTDKWCENDKFHKATFDEIIKKFSKSDEIY